MDKKVGLAILPATAEAATTAIFYEQRYLILPKGDDNNHYNKINLPGDAR